MSALDALVTTSSRLPHGSKRRGGPPLFPTGRQGCFPHAAVSDLQQWDGPDPSRVNNAGGCSMLLWAASRLVESLAGDEEIDRAVSVSPHFGWTSDLA